MSFAKFHTVHDKQEIVFAATSAKKQSFSGFVLDKLLNLVNKKVLPAYWPCCEHKCKGVFVAQKSARVSFRTLASLTFSKRKTLGIMKVLV